ncbi:MAG: hypothetical protein KKE20_02715 [Nanoarchaeota archaeon]|nr:hypothetical protein [Nanoarchaeota archaeon]
MSTIKDNAIGKKAVVEVQFNWIFVLVAGALILVFFITIINKQKTVSEKKLSVEILNSMDRIMSGQKASENRQDVISMFEVEMSYSCGGCDCDFSLAGMSKSKGNLVVFAPTSTESDRLLTWTQSWDMPFRVINFIYISIPENKYYFINPTPNIKNDFIGNLPVNLTVDIVSSVDDITYKGEQKVRLVFFDEDDLDMPDGLAKADDSRITALVIEGIAPDWEKGKAKLKFYRKKGDVFIEDEDEEGTTYEYPALGFPAVYGAVYSDSFQNYKCNMDDAVIRLGFVSKVYNSRASKLDTAVNNIASLRHCVYLYSTVYFNGFEQDYNNIHTAGLFESIRTLASFNDQAILLSCPRIY